MLLICGALLEFTVFLWHHSPVFFKLSGITHLSPHGLLEDPLPMGTLSIIHSVTESVEHLLPYARNRACLWGNNIIQPLPSCYWHTEKLSRQVEKQSWFSPTNSVMAGIGAAGGTQEFYPNREGPWSLSLKISFALLFHFKIIHI